MSDDTEEFTNETTVGDDYTDQLFENQDHDIDAGIEKL